MLRPVFWNVMTTSVVQFALLVLFARHRGIVGVAYAAALALVLEQTGLTIRTFHRFKIRPAGLLARIWRGLAASAAMTAFLALSGLGWRAVEGTFAADLRQLLLISGTGAAGYTCALLGLWLLSGKPDGPEADILKLAGRIAVRLRGLIGRGAAVL
jgi:hypothetical protein